MTSIKNEQSIFPSLWEEFFDKTWFGTPNIVQTGTSVPAVNIKETADSFAVEMAAPGMKKEDFEVNLENNLLSISAEITATHTAEGEYTRREYNYRSFKRSFTVPDNVDEKKIAAAYIDGVLHIVIPKLKKAKPKSGRNIKVS